MNFVNEEESFELEQEFIRILYKLGIYRYETVEDILPVQIYGYERNVHYHEYRMNEEHNLDFSSFDMVDNVETSKYGFTEEESLIHITDIDTLDYTTDVNSASFSIESVVTDSFTKDTVFTYVINGDPSDIDLISDFQQLYIELKVSGCKRNALFWENAMYVSYLSYKNNNYIGSFMYLFIAFEGLLRFLSKDTKTLDLKKVYKDYTKRKFSEKLKDLKKNRNSIMHGNENLDIYIDEDTLFYLLEEIENLKFN